LNGVIPKIGSRDFRHDLDVSHDELAELLALTADVKAHPERYRGALTGNYIGILFEKPSLRTRLTFELAIKQLGGDSVTSVGKIGGREPLKDVARNMDRWTQCIVARTFEQETIDRLAEWSRVPVVNALSEIYHPCQALADVFTLKERFGELRGLKVAFVGDGNNVAHSLMLTAVRQGASFSIATPDGYQPYADVVREAGALAELNGASLEVTDDAEAAVAGAHAIYTDVWTSMGFEEEASERRVNFQPYQVTPDLMALADPEAVFMHCLPARRDEEVVDEVIESDRSVVFDQAENRLHTQKALLLMLMDGR
jgi:ornithine carbamoyltransferase